MTREDATPARVGQRLRFRFMDPLPQPYTCDTVNIAAWALRCHVLGHAEAATGMFGTVTALIVT